MKKEIKRWANGETEDAWNNLLAVNKKLINGYVKTKKRKLLRNKNQVPGALNYLFQPFSTKGLYSCIFMLNQ